MNIPGFPEADYRAHQDEIDAAIQTVVHSGRFILGEEVAGFEVEFADYLGAGPVVALASGTDAVEVALRLCGLSRGGLVATVSNTAVATVAAIERAGGAPLFVDVDPVTLTMDPGSLDESLGAYEGRVEAVVPVHLFGKAADISSIVEVATSRGVPVVEDCAQAHGAEIDGTKVGAVTGLGAFSFYPTKNLGAMGDAGALVATDHGAAAQAMRQYGWVERYISETSGLNSRMDELQAAVLRVKLKYLDEENGRRRVLAARYREVLQTSVVVPPMLHDPDHVFHQFVIRTPDRDALREHLAHRGIAAAVHYPSPIHRQPAYSGKVVAAPGGLAATERANDEILSLPLHPHMTEDQVEEVAGAVVEWAGGR